MSAEYNRLRARARQAAWRELEKKYPEDFARFHDIARADLGLDPTQAQTERVHGTRAMYKTGCRCEPCTVANRSYQRGYMQLRRQGIPWVSPVDEYLEG